MMSVEGGFLEYINNTDKCVQVHLANERILNGVLYCVDPLTCSIVLVDVQNTGNVSIINSECITNFECVCDDNCKTSHEKCDQFFMESLICKDVDFVQIKSTLKRVLEEHLFHVIEENDSLKINDMCVINPPYTAQSCICSDTIQLELIEDLIKQINISSILKDTKDNQQNLNNVYVVEQTQKYNVPDSSHTRPRNLDDDDKAELISDPSSSSENEIVTTV